MKKLLELWVLFTLLLGISVTATAATPAETIAPFFTETTVVAIKVDLTKVDLTDVEKELIKVVNSAAQMSDTDKKRAIDEMHRSMITANDWVTAMKNAGGKEIYVIFDILQLQRGGPILVVPKTDGADVKAISGLLHSGKADGPTGIPDAAPSSQPVRAGGFGNQQSVEIKGVVVHATKTWIDQISNAAPVDRPNISKAFESAGNGMVSGVIIPSETVRAMMEQAMPVLPPQLGGGPITDISRGIDWISFSVESTAKQETLVVAQATNPESAAKIEEVANTSIDVLLGNQEMMAAVPEMGKILGNMRPAVEGSKLSITLKQDSAIASILLPRLVMARQQAMNVRSASNMRQLLLAMMLYSNENKGDFPAELTDLKKYVGNNPDAFNQIMINPDSPDRKPGYIYVKPAGKINQLKESMSHLLLYENFDRWPGKVNVGFADGHVEVVSDKVRFEKLLTDAGGTMPEEKKP